MGSLRDVTAVQVVMDKATVVACVDGELDLASIDGVHQQLLACAGQETCRALVIDMRSAAFVDSQGLNMLLVLRRDLNERGQQLYVVVCDSTFLAKLFRVAGLDDVLAVHHRLGDALAAASQPDAVAGSAGGGNG
jgi:anti-anti-sigma factor